MDMLNRRTNLLSIYNWKIEVMVMLNEQEDKSYGHFEQED